MSNVVDLPGAVAMVESGNAGSVLEARESIAPLSGLHTEPPLIVEERASRWRKFKDALECLNRLPNAETFANTVPEAERAMVTWKLPIAATVAANYDRNDDACQATAEEWQARFEEDSPEKPEPDYAQVARALALVKDEHLDLHAEMSMGISLAKKYGGIGTVCRALGVSEAAAQTVGFLGLSRISISDVRYEPSEGGPLAVVIPVADSPWSEEPEVCDLLAFLSDVPNRCWSRLGNARCLGRWHLRDAVSKAVWPIRGDNREPVIAYRTPLEWLRGGCNGFCCLSEDWLAFETVGIPSIQPANGDVEFGRHLKRLIHEQARLPKIVIPKAAA